MSSIIDIKYFKNYVDLEISNFKTSLLDKELYSRNILNRAYYTSFLHCRDLLGLSNSLSGSIHRDVIEGIKNNTVKNKLTKLLRYRKDADYKNYYLNKSITDLLDAQRTMNYILTLTKIDLDKI